MSLPTTGGGYKWRIQISRPKAMGTISQPVQLNKVQGAIGCVSSVLYYELSRTRQGLLAIVYKIGFRLMAKDSFAYGLSIACATSRDRLKTFQFV